MSISDWINKREMTGFPTFSFTEVKEAFPALSDQIISNHLYYLSKSKRIQTVHKGFYTAVSLQYRDRGVVPPYNYIDQLMTYLGKPYYISLLSAGVLHGAAHQRPQQLTISTSLPRISFTKNANAQLNWCYRKDVSQTLLNQTNSDTGTLWYSCPELTAVDLVQFNQIIGGLSVAATVLEELSERTNFTMHGEELINATTIPTLQRLGYIFDCILNNTVQADAMANLLKSSGKQVKYVPLSINHPISNSVRDTKWKIIINQDIEPDDIW